MATIVVVVAMVIVPLAVVAALVVVALVVVALEPWESENTSEDLRRS